jgi:AmmeMemoRadiSam system protein A
MIDDRPATAAPLPADDRDLGHALLTIARSAIAARLELPRAEEPDAPALQQPAATFVTLRAHGELRGCIGSLEPSRALRVDVRENAIAAAFRDPRFPPLAAGEFPATSIEVSLLSKAEQLFVTDERDLVRRLRPGVDGLILEHDGRRTTYLPQVWDAIPDPYDFIVALKRKAGWPEGFWGPRMSVFRYAATKWTERESTSWKGIEP